MTPKDKNPSKAAPSKGHQNGAYDRLGVFASAACAVHCLAAPLLFLAVPAIADVWSHPLSHAVIALVVLPLASSVLLRGYRLHGRRWIAASTVIGIGAVIVGCILPYVGGPAESAVAAEESATACACCLQVVEDEAGGSKLEIPPASIATLIGSAFLVASHLGNLVSCRSCK